MKRVRQATSADSSANARSALGSRSMPISNPAGPRRSATRRAWPAPPRVQSTATSPGRGSRASISSPARTGTCSRVISSRMANGSDVVSRPGDQVGLVGLPAVAVPELQVLARAHDHDVLRDPGVLQEARRQVDAPGRVQLHRDGVPVQVALEVTRLRAQRVQSRERLLGDPVVVLRRPDLQAALEALDQRDAAGQLGPGLGRHGEPVLRVQRVVVVPLEGQGAWVRRTSWWKSVDPGWLSGRNSATPDRLVAGVVPHDPPLCNTKLSSRPTRGGQPARALTKNPAITGVGVVGGRVHAGDRRAVASGLDTVAACRSPPVFSSPCWLRRPPWPAWPDAVAAAPAPAPAAPIPRT